MKKVVTFILFTFLLNNVLGQTNSLLKKSFQKGNTVLNEKIMCGSTPNDLLRSPSLLKAKNTSASSSEVLRTFRLALLVSGEVSQDVLTNLGVANSASDEEKKSVVLNWLNSLVTRMNVIYERDLSIKFQLVENNDKIIFLDPNEQGVSDYFNKNKEICDEKIGSENYHIAHALIQSSFLNLEGIAVSNDCAEHKAGGISRVEYDSERGFNTLIHEIGHQFGADHTYNYQAPSYSSTGIELGRGKTIMVHAKRALFFHAISIRQINEYIANHMQCYQEKAIENKAPKIEALKNYTIPKLTPFVLEGKVIDEDKSHMMYSWEQINHEPAPQIPTANVKVGPVFAWMPPSSKPYRYFPKLETLLDGKLKNQEEALSGVTRNLDFTFLVRDASPKGGVTVQKNMQLTVDENAGPFYMHTFNKPETLYAGANYTLEWEVGNTDKGAVNTPKVDILFSKDGGENFDIKLAEEVPNNGKYRITIPMGIETEQGRIMIRGHEHIFFDINNAPLIIKKTDFVVTSQEDNQSVCLKEEREVNYHLKYKTIEGFTEGVKLKAESNNAINLELTPTTVTANGTSIALQVTNFNQEKVGKHKIKITASFGDKEYVKELGLYLYSKEKQEVSLKYPENNATKVFIETPLKWKFSPNTEKYQVEVAEDEDFSTIVVAKITKQDSLQLPKLKYGTKYFWRIKPYNKCYEGEYTAVQMFTTVDKEEVNTYIPDDVFEESLQEMGLDNGELDNYVLTKNIDTLTTLEITGKNIKSLEGIKDFKSLKTLVIGKGKLHGTIDLSANKKLTKLKLQNNEISKIVLPSQNLLEDIDLSQNKLQQLDLREQRSLQSLNCSSNLLTSLKLSLYSVNLYQVNIAGNLLSACALDDIFLKLPLCKKDNNIVPCYKIRNITIANWDIFLDTENISNPGVETCDTTIATQKEWKVRSVKLEEGNEELTHIQSDGTGCSNHSPIADAGDGQVVSAGNKGVLDGSKSYDYDGDSLTYEWIAPEGIVLNNAAAVQPTFIAPDIVEESKKYIFHLRVSDGVNSSELSEVSILVMNKDFGLPAIEIHATKLDNLRLGLSLLQRGKVKIYDGTEIKTYEIGSDNESMTDLFINHEGVILVYENKEARISKVNLEGISLEAISLSNCGALKYLDVSNNYILEQLDVSSNSLLEYLRCGSNDLKELDVRGLKYLRRLEASSNKLEKVLLQDNNSLSQAKFERNNLSACALDDIFINLPNKLGFIDLNNDATNYNPGTNTCATSIATNKGWKVQYWYYNSQNNKWETKQLVGDGTGCSNHKPIADAGENQEVEPNAQVTLDGSKSYDYDGNSLTYQWTAPEGVTLSNVAAVQPTFTAPDKIIDCIFMLTVNDGGKNSESSEVLVKVISTDNDKDGVKNDKDQCPNTPQGESVDEKGCSQSQLDDDNDSVMNNKDKCPDTPSGVEVNDYGCSIFKLPEDNFTIEVSDETCYGQNNGVLSITAKEEHPYKVTIGDERYEFTKDFTLNTLSPKDYEFCISVENTDYKQCFEFTIKKGYQLRAETQLRNRKMSVAIEEGTAPFEVYVNNRLEKTTDDMNFELLVQHGDKVEILSQKRCEGALEKRVWLFTDIKAYPNPTPTGMVRLSIPIPDRSVHIDICNAGGMVLSYRVYNIQNRMIDLDLQNYPSGVYIVKIYLEKMVSLKIVKQ